MDSRTVHFRSFQLLGNLGWAVAIHTPCKDLAYNHSGFLVYDPMFLWVIRVFHVAVGRIGSQVLPGFAFLLHGRLDLLAAVLDVKLVDDVQERCKVIVLLIGAVHTAIESNEATSCLGKSISV